MSKSINYDNTSKSNGKSSKIQENMALKAFSETDDLDEIANIARFKSRSEAMRTLDKLQHRREYQDALARHGLDFDFIVSNLKDKVLAANSEKIQMAALQVLMKSIGIDKYDDVEGGGKNWEELLLEVHREKGKSKKETKEIEFYDVEVPETPQKYKEMREEENKLIEGIYDKPAN